MVGMVLAETDCVLDEEAFADDSGCTMDTLWAYSKSGEIRSFACESVE